MITIKQFEKDYKNKDFSKLRLFYDENYDFLEEILKYIRISNPDNVFLINKIKNYLKNDK